MKSRQHSRPFHWGVIVCLWLLFAQMALAAPQLSLTYDEPIYTAVGYADLTTGDVRWHEVVGHPPLINLLTAWPLLLGANRPDATKISGWGTEDLLGFSRSLVAQLGPPEYTAFVTRIPVMLLTLLLATVVYRWAQQTWGGAAGLLALGLFVFDPNIIAHGQLNTTDMGITAFGFMGCYALARYLRRPSWGTYLGAGLGIGAALASKASGPFWLGCFGLTALASWLQEPPARRFRRVGYWAIMFSGWMGLALLVLWAAYLFELRPLSPGGIAIPAASHWASLSYIGSYMATGQDTFLAGKLVAGGHWSYFPIALMIKTPIPILIGLSAALVWFFRHRCKPAWSTILLTVIPVAYLIVAMRMALNIGHRHMLTVYPFCFVFIAQLFGKRGLLYQRAPQWKMPVSGLLMAWYVVGTVRIFPHYLAYFNELAGGPEGGYRYLADSSVDWGQGFYALRAYLEAENADEVYLAAFSSVDPAWYGMDFIPLPPTPGEDVPLWLPRRFNPAVGRYAISVTPLQGLWLLDPDTYDWFRHRQPTERVSYNFFIYDVVEKTDAEWVAQCAAPQPVLDAAQIADGFGRSDLRRVVFDCETSWLYPTSADGWIVLPGDQPLTAWAAERLNQATLSFRQGKFWNHPAVAIYEQRQTPPSAIPPQTGVRIAPTDWALNRATTDGIATAAPVNMGEPLTFLGYGIQSLADGVELHTYWRVDGLPTRPLSLMAHALNDAGQSITIADGLGVPIEFWHPGDIIIQRHRFIIENAISGAYWLQTGAYWLDTMERWPITTDGQVIGDRILLTEISR